MKDAFTAKNQAISPENVLRTKKGDSLVSIKTTKDTITGIIGRDMRDKGIAIAREVMGIDIKVKETGLIETIVVIDTNITIEEEDLLLHGQGHTVGSVAIDVTIAPNLPQEAMTADMARQAIAGVTTKETIEIVIGIGMSLEEDE